MIIIAFGKNKISSILLFSCFVEIISCCAHHAHFQDIEIMIIAVRKNKKICILFFSVLLK